MFTNIPSISLHAILYCLTVALYPAGRTQKINIDVDKNDNNTTFGTIGIIPREINEEHEVNLTTNSNGNTSGVVSKSLGDGVVSTKIDDRQISGTIDGNLITIKIEDSNINAIARKAQPIIIGDLKADIQTIEATINEESIMGSITQFDGTIRKINLKINENNISGIIE